MVKRNNTYKDALLNEVNDVVLSEVQKLNKGILSESKKKSTVRICEEMKKDLGEYVIYNYGLNDKNIRESIIKIDLYERLGIYHTRKGLKMLMECIEKINNNVLNEEYYPGYAITGYKAVNNNVESNNDYSNNDVSNNDEEEENIGKDLAVNAGILGGFEAGRHGVGAIKAARKGTKYIPKSTAGDSLMFGMGKNLSRKTYRAMGKGGKLTVNGMTKLFNYLGKWFPKLGKLAPKVAKWGPKAVRAAAVGATFGAWLIVEAVLAIISLGGKALLNSNTKTSQWCIKKLLSFYEKGGKIAAIVDAVWMFFGYTDIKELVLTRAIQLGYITNEEAQEIEVNSNLFGDFMANDFTNVKRDTNAIQNNVAQNNEKQKYNYNYNLINYTPMKINEERLTKIINEEVKKVIKEGNAGVPYRDAKPYQGAKNKSTVQTSFINGQEQEEPGAGTTEWTLQNLGLKTPDIKTIFKQVSQLNKGKGWIAGAKAAGWPDAKIQAYRKLINQYYAQQKQQRQQQYVAQTRNLANNMKSGLEDAARTAQLKQQQSRLQAEPLLAGKNQLDVNPVNPTVNLSENGTISSSDLRSLVRSYVKESLLKEEKDIVNGEKLGKYIKEHVTK